MNAKLQEIDINGVKYVPKDEALASSKPAVKNGLPYVICRTYSAGVFAGYLEYESADSKKVVLRQARRLWQWYGAASLSQLAQEGTSKPAQCKFPCEVDKVKLTEVIEMDYCTEKARLSIQGVKVWTA